jgi:hypothetical protein
MLVKSVSSCGVYCVLCTAMIVQRNIVERWRNLYHEKAKMSFIFILDIYVSLSILYNIKITAMEIKKYFNLFLHYILLPST